MTVNWGVIGCGDIARKRVAAAIQLDPRSQLLAACRRGGAKLRAFCDDFNVPRAYQSAGQLLADEEIDAVYIATPVKDHRPQTIAAAAAGKHVICEKPMALSAAECDEMIAACAGASVRLSVAYYRRFYPMVRRIGQLLSDGAIGTPLSVNIVCATPLAIPPGEDGYWRVVPEAGGGGALMDIGSHRINLLLELFGPVAEIKAMCGTLAADYEAENVATVLFRFESSLHATMTCLFGTPVDPDRFEVIGTRGRLLASPLNGSELVIDDQQGTRTEHCPPHENLHYPLIADFTAAIESARPPTVTGEEGRATTAVIDQIYAAALSPSPSGRGSG